MKVGDKVNFTFKCFGIVSVEETEVIDVDGDMITVSDTWTSDKSGQEENGKFSIKSGKCLNDNTSFGASRCLDKG